MLVIEVERHHTYAWGAETTQIRWYCFVHERRPRCVELALAYLEEDSGEHRLVVAPTGLPFLSDGTRLRFRTQGA